MLRSRVSIFTARLASSGTRTKPMATGSTPSPTTLSVTRNVDMRLVTSGVRLRCNDDVTGTMRRGRLGVREAKSVSNTRGTPRRHHGDPRLLPTRLPCNLQRLQHDVTRSSCARVRHGVEGCLFVACARLSARGAIWQEPPVLEGEGEMQLWGRSLALTPLLGRAQMNNEVAPLCH